MFCSEGPPYYYNCENSENELSSGKVPLAFHKKNASKKHVDIKVSDKNRVWDCCRTQMQALQWIVTGLEIRTPLQECKFK